MKFIFALITIILLYLVYTKITHREEPCTEAQYLAEYGTPEEKKQQQVLNQKELILLSTTWCGACKNAKNYLKTKGIPFTEYDAEKSEQGRSLMKKYNGRGYPTLIIGDESISGFDSRWVEERL